MVFSLSGALPVTQRNWLTWVKFDHPYEKFFCGGNSVKMEPDDLRAIGGRLSILVVLLCRNKFNALITQFVLLRRRRIRMRRWQFIHRSEFIIRYFCEVAGRVAARAPRTLWILARPQNLFQQLLHDWALNHWWKENLKVTRATFEYICN